MHPSKETFWRGWGTWGMRQRILTDSHMHFFICSKISKYKKSEKTVLSENPPVLGSFSGRDPRNMMENIFLVMVLIYRLVPTVFFLSDHLVLIQETKLCYWNILSFFLGFRILFAAIWPENVEFSIFFPQFTHLVIQLSAQFVCR